MNLFASDPGMFIHHGQYVLLIHMSDVFQCCHTRRSGGRQSYCRSIGLKIGMKYRYVTLYCGNDMYLFSASSTEICVERSAILSVESNDDTVS